MPEQHVQLLTALGVPKESIDALEGLKPEQLKDWKPDELVTAIQTPIQTKLSNDANFLASIPKDKINPTILKEIEKGQYARFQNELVDVATKKLGLEDKELTEEDRKSIKGLAEKMAVLYLGKKGNVEGLQKMQQELAEARQALENVKTEHTANLTKELEKVNGANSAKLIKTLIKVGLKDLDGVDLPVAAGFISEPVLALMNSKYSIVLDANDNLDIKQKDNVALDVIDKAGKKVTFMDALKETVLTNKLGVEKKQEGGGGPRSVIVKPGGGEGGEGGSGELVPSYIANKINKNGNLTE